MVALFRLLSAWKLLLFLFRGMTLRVLRLAHLLVACDNEARGNCTVERSETGTSAPAVGQTRRFLS